MSAVPPIVRCIAGADLAASVPSASDSLMPTSDDEHATRFRGQQAVTTSQLEWPRGIRTCASVRS